ncbi:hypothetical protein HPP92_019109 [Vanilla planifolia]|uniref:Chloride channel protein n=1 Tax=Vanilla planifolia TaxID=51239 RepID=A0A835Q2A4_VANPL|nr:hypothetical protein HPP92_019109 [Vanilla planifolia]
MKEELLFQEKQQLQENTLESYWETRGIIVGVLNSLRNQLERSSWRTKFFDASTVLSAFFKAIAASITLGTGNSLGPEGPSVEIGSSIAKAVSNVFKWNAGKQVGLGSDPTFTVPEYDFRSPSELPLYLLLGILCGLVALILSKSTSVAMEVAGKLEMAVGNLKALFPALGGLTVGLIALAYPEVLYWGFQNVDIVGMAATLAGVCQVPLTSVLLLFELTQDYRIVLPLLGAVGLSSWISSNQDRRNSRHESRKVEDGGNEHQVSTYCGEESDYSLVTAELVHDRPLCDLEQSLCVYDHSAVMAYIAERLLVAQAMRTSFITAQMSTTIDEVLKLMLMEKQSYVLITDSNGFSSWTVITEKHPELQHSEAAQLHVVKLV